MSILTEIVAHKRQELTTARAARPRAELERRCRDQAPPRDFERALRPAPGGVRLVAEVKKASPSRGVLAADLDPVALAATYARHGADAISVLTDAKYFQGSLDVLRRVRATVDVPLLRKDFTIDEYQLWEAREAGADAVLLIVAALGRERLGELMGAASDLGMDSLIEVHDEDEVEVAVEAGAELLGINNRDLHSLEVDLGTTFRLMADVPAGTVVVAESGITERGHVADLEDAGVDAILVGEALMRADDPAHAVRDLLG
jgi:indole-3-glycerol phosphate synthase